MKYPLRIFFSRPNYLHEESAAAEAIVDQINLEFAKERPKTLVLIPWDDPLYGTGSGQTVAPGGGQAVINEDLQLCPIYVGLMADRFGKGTAEEFRLARRLFIGSRDRRVMFYFKRLFPESFPPGELEKITEFKQEVWKSGVTPEYNDIKGLKELLLRDLRCAIRELPGPKFLLTSESPRRLRLLSQLGLDAADDFKAVQIDTKVVEGKANLNKVEQTALEMATEKVMDAFHKFEQYAGGLERESTIIIGADTLVSCNDVVFDRPQRIRDAFVGRYSLINEEEQRDARSRAQQMLRLQSGQVVHIVTGLVVARADRPNQLLKAAVQTLARLKQLSESEIDAYLSDGEAFTRCGALALDSRGVALFEEIEGSYSNVVGLPLRKLMELIRQLPGYAYERFVAHRHKGKTASFAATSLSVISVGDINFDLVCDSIDRSKLSHIDAPGVKMEGRIERRVGGTAVNFAIRAKEAGFQQARVAGNIGRDPLGEFLQQELERQEIELLLRPIPGFETSVAIILRGRTEGPERFADLSLTLTDARQRLDPNTADHLKPMISESNVLYVSGYALLDPRRQEPARAMLLTAHKESVVTIVDVVVGMDQRWQGFNGTRSFEEFVAWLQPTPAKSETCCQVLVSETSEMLRWVLGPEADAYCEDWNFIRQHLIPRLRPHFRAIILRTPKYTQELIVTPRNVEGELIELDYQTLPNDKRLGYGDSRTAMLIYDWLVPCVLLASRSPQRLELLRQIIDPGKICTIDTNVDEAATEDDRTDPRTRVTRLATAKAEFAWQLLLDSHSKSTNRSEESPVAGSETIGPYASTIEVIVAADTEAVLKQPDGTWELISQPLDDNTAREMLQKLEGREHSMLTGLCVIGVDPTTRRHKVVQKCVETKVKFAKLDEADIEGYVQSQEPLGKAGGYGIQGFADTFVEKIQGSYSNIVGLPLEMVCSILADEFAMSIWDMNKVSGWRRSIPLTSAEK